MLFHFASRIPVTQLEAEFADFFGLLKAEKLDEVSGLQISLLGWRGDARCEIRNRHSRIGEVTFDRLQADDDSELPVRKARPNFNIRDRPEDLEWRPIATVLAMDD
jgi:hypothetical protein